MEQPVLILLLLALCLAVSFLLSGMEAGVFALSRLRIRHLMRAGNPAAKLLHGYLENSENFLWTILVGNTLASFAAVTLTVVVLYRSLGESRWLFLLVFLLSVFLFYALCDLLPKMLFRLYPNRLCLGMAQPFRFVHVALMPLVSLLTYISHEVLRWTGGKMFTGHLFGNRDELRRMLQETSAALSTEERAMITRVLDLQNVTVRQITVPLDKVVSLAPDTPLSGLFALAREKRVTRFPVGRADGEPRRIAGVLDLETLLYQPEIDAARAAREFVKPALFIEEDLRLEVALQRIRRSGQPLAIVLGHDRREIGIVTLQDILKFIFGEVSL